MQGQFVDLMAAADYLGPAAIEVDRYQTEIFDIRDIRRDSLRRRRSRLRQQRRRSSIRAISYRRCSRRPGLRCRFR